MVEPGQRTLKRRNLAKSSDSQRPAETGEGTRMIVNVSQGRGTSVFALFSAIYFLSDSAGRKNLPFGALVALL